MGDIIAKAREGLRGGGWVGGRGGGHMLDTTFGLVYATLLRFRSESKQWANFPPPTPLP